MGRLKRLMYVGFREMTKTTKGRDIFKYPRESFILRLGLTCSPSDRITYWFSQKERGCGCRWAYGIYVSKSGSNLLQHMVRAYKCEPGCGFYFFWCVKSCNFVAICTHSVSTYASDVEGI